MGGGDAASSAGPPLPAGCAAHPLWARWDEAVRGVLAQLPALLGYSLYDLQRVGALGGRIDKLGARA